ncbi:DUF6541 family protein [Thermophilibacter immobilis]
MWTLFFVAYLLTVVLLYLPGFLVLLATRLPRIEALCLGPLISLSFYGVWCTSLASLGIQASVSTVALPLLLVGAGAWLMSRGVHKDRATGIAPGRRSSWSKMLYGSDWCALVAYVAFGVVAVAIVFVGNLDGPASFLQEYDNGAHLGEARSFLSSGNYSPFSPSPYPQVPADQTMSPFVMGGGFYPALWHALVALVAGTLGAPLTLAVNATNAALVGTVFPVSTFLLLRRLFGAQRHSALWAGAMVTLAFTTFPWDFLSFGPLYPNLLGNVILFLPTVCFMRMFEDGLGAGGRMGWGTLFFVGCVALVLSHSGAVFTMAVLLAPFCVWQGYRLSRAAGRSPAFSCGLACTVALGVAFIWCVCYKLPFLRSVVLFNWPATVSIPQAVADALSLAFFEHTAQPVLAFLVLAGAASLTRKAGARWLVAPFGFSCVSFVVAMSSEGLIKRLLAGFWYTDPHRLAANAALMAIPLAAWGMSVVFEWAARPLERRSLARPAELDPSLRPCSLALVAALSAAIFLPSYELGDHLSVQTSFGSQEERINAQNDTSAPNVLSSDEIAFSQEALLAVPEGSLILNSPNDGSAFLYGLYGANVYYRRFDLPSNERSESADSRLMRESLDKFAMDQSVQDAVERSGATYLLLLDQGEEASDARRHFWSYYPEQWLGFESVSDETPGFTVVLARGDMRLYRIGL